MYILIFRKESMACVQKFRKCGLKPNWETNLYLSLSAFFFLGSLLVNSNSIVFVALYMLISPPSVTGGDYRIALRSSEQGLSGPYFLCSFNWISKTWYVSTSWDGRVSHPKTRSPQPTFWPLWWGTRGCSSNAPSCCIYLCLS